jgi:hypothetical protein
VCRSTVFDNSGGKMKKKIADTRELFLIKKIHAAIQEKDLPVWRPRRETNPQFRFCETCKRWNCLPIRFL